jgi:hypothetical protein
MLAEPVPRAAHASPPPESARVAVPGAPVSIWYRSSEGCPDGAAFIARLSALGRQSALANVGDHIDFVVTLAARLTTSAGRLERQTARGTVAIRELEAARCEEVAEALALSLELALEPHTEPAASVSAVRGDTPKLPNDAAARPSSERTELPPARTLPAALDATPLAASGESSEAEPPFRFGAQGRVATGISPAPAPGATLFVELGDPADEVAARLSLNGVYRETTVASVELDVAVVAARLDGCALGWRTGVFSIGPCVGLDVGLLAAAPPALQRTGIEGFGPARRVCCGRAGASGGTLRPKSSWVCWCRSCVMRWALRRVRICSGPIRWDWRAGWARAGRRDHPARPWT